MKKLTEYADQWIKESDWKTIGLLKVCLCALGILIGFQLPRNKKMIPWAAAAVFVLACIPLITRFVKTAVKE